MKAASRGSAATSRERLDAVVAKAKVDAAKLADELRSVARLFVREPALRRAFVDPARSAEARVELLEGVLGSQVSGDTLDILRTVVSGRWSRATDLLNTIEVLSVEAELAAAEKAVTGPERPGAGGQLADVEDELFRFSRVVGGDPQLASALSDPAADVERKVALARDLLSGKATEFTVRLVELAISGLGGRNFDASLQRLVELTADRRDRQVAYVRVAAPLTDEQEERLSARLSGLYGRQISLKVTVDPAIIGGATVQVGDDLYDGSVARRLDQARTALTK